MARPIPPDRFAALIDVATATFVAQGYSLAQMQDVADVMGVAKGIVCTLSTVRSTIARAWTWCRIMSRATAAPVACGRGLCDVWWTRAPRRRTVVTNGVPRLPGRTRRHEVVTFLVLALFVGLVVALSHAAHRTGTSAPGCCAPADPRSDLRMRGAFGDVDDMP